ncbi:hypothetical protein [Allohahella sp. A8]|uniref:hypothetical protein n=1 Tax=Allohahella sp. A8 TaxID=3141461 RepID=UPI003A811787
MKTCFIALLLIASQYSLASEAEIAASATNLLPIDGQIVPYVMSSPQTSPSNAGAAFPVQPCYRASATETASVPSSAFHHLFEPSLSSYWPGLNGSVWISRSENQLFALRDLRVLRDNLAAVGQPRLSLYDAAGITLLSEDMLNLHALETSKGLLLTAHFRTDSALKCIDILMAKHSQAEARGSRLYFSKDGTLYTKTLEFRRLMSASAKAWQQ